MRFCLEAPGLFFLPGRNCFFLNTLKISPGFELFFATICLSTQKALKRDGYDQQEAVPGRETDVESDESSEHV